MNEDDIRKARDADCYPVLPNTQSPHAPHIISIPLKEDEESWASLLTLLDVSPDALVMVDAAGCIVLVNRQ
ncbi:MAG TPA: hypothetical protein VJ761_16070, partial [Ktedonobacteraceae bacterium]|nr:hypothetical protein [Ktedonobacteraceae bacterium]